MGLRLPDSFPTLQLAMQSRGLTWAAEFESTLGLARENVSRPLAYELWPTLGKCTFFGEGLDSWPFAGGKEIGQDRHIHAAGDKPASPLGKSVEAVAAETRAQLAAGSAAERDIRAWQTQGHYQYCPLRSLSSQHLFSGPSALDGRILSFASAPTLLICGLFHAWATVLPREFDNLIHPLFQPQLSAGPR